MTIKARIASARAGQAWKELRETLGHWKEGTRPCDDNITEADVVRAIVELIEARCDERDAAREPHGDALGERKMP